jgi:hypothetical protein
MLRYESAIAVNDPPVQVDSGPVPTSASPSLAALLRQVQVAAGVAEFNIYDLDAVLGEFDPDDVRDDVWAAATNASTVIEIANLDIQGAIADLVAAVKASS